MKKKGENLALAVLGAILAGFVIYGSFLNPNEMVLSQALKAPSHEHLFGTDHLGRDILARVAYGFYWDLSLSSTIVGLSMAAGICLGLWGGYLGGPADKILILIMDLILSMPHLVLAMVIMVYLSYGPEALVIALALPGWVKYARIIRAQTYSVKKMDFIVYEKVVGAGVYFILFRHILPNVIPPALGLAVLHLGHSLLSIAALGFLGLGLQPPTPEWGAMVMESRPYIMIAPWTAIFPGLFIFLFIMFFSLLGYKLERRFNPIEGGGDALH